MENPAVNASVRVMMSQPQKWRNLLNQFEDVLGLSIFAVDPSGQLIVALSPSGQKGDFGVSLLKKTFAFEVNQEKGILLANFTQSDSLLQMVDPFDLHVFAVPVVIENDEAKLYLIAGPIVMNKPWPDAKYLALADQLGILADDFLKDIHCVPQMSSSAANAILDLLAEVVRDVLELEAENTKLHSMQSASQIVRPEIIDAAQDIFATIQEDELLVSILDSAIKMSHAQGGSIMLLDPQTGEFSIRVSRGLENKKNILQSRIKIGEGIAGFAAKEKTPLFIKGTESNASLRPFLKRPEIKHSIVIPLIVEEKVIGVLNLCTKSHEHDAAAGIEHIVRDVQQLSRFISIALQSL